MADPLQLAILKNLTTLLETTVDPTVGAAPGATMAGKVFRGRALFSDTEPLPLVSILEGATPDDVPRLAGRSASRQAFEWPLLIQGWAENDVQNPTDPVYLLKAEVEKKLALILGQDNGMPGSAQGPYYMLGHHDKGVNRVTIAPGVVRPADGRVSARAFFYFPLVVDLAVDFLNP